MSPGGVRSTLRRWRADETLIVLAGAYFLLATLYAWQAWRRETLTIFTDELEMTQISRAIAETGWPARRGETYHLTTLVPWLTAPFWWISSVGVAYELVKYAQALVMPLAVLPTYALARTVVSKQWALFAAVATIAAPALSYAPILVEEPFAYPAAALAFWLLVRAAAHPTRRTVGAAAAGAVLGAAVRSQLVSLVATLLLVLLVLGWSSERVRRWRSTWSRWDQVGAVALAIGAVLAFSAFMGHRSQEWEITTAYWKGRIVEYGAWAAGAFTIGVGILPVIALVAVLGLPRAERARPGVRAFVIVAGAAVVSFGWYAAVKGAYLSTVFSSVVPERNLVYLAPLAFTAAALLLERASAPVWALLVGGAVALVLVIAVPIGRGLDNFPYYEAHGLSILALANRELVWAASTINAILIGIVVVATGALVALAVRRGHHGLAWLPVTLAVLVLGWNLTNEVYASIGEHDLSARIEGNLDVPHDWIDRAVGDGKVTILGQQLTDPTGVWSNEFWNRSIVNVWTVDGTGPGPGPTLTPDLARPDGTLWPTPNTPYVLAVNGVDVAGKVVAEGSKSGEQLVRIGDTLRLRANEIGVFSDGWMSSSAAYNRFDVSRDGRTQAIVSLSRETFCPKGVRLPGLVRVRIGPIGVGADKQPAIARVTGQEVVYVPACGSRVVALPAPDRPWRVEVTAQTFVPAEVDPAHSSDRRHLGAVVDFRVAPR